MPLDSAIVGHSIAAHTHKVDARWLMAYAAALEDLSPCYLDTAAHAVSAHPVFPVCLEWPVILDMRNIPALNTLTPDEAARGVHAAHDLHLLKPITEGETLTTQAQMIGVQQIPPGARYTMRLDTFNTQGDLVSRTYQTGIYRDVKVTGGDAEDEPLPQSPALQDLSDASSCTVQPLPVQANLAHTYTECARIWNPIHTDRKIALAAGLPDIILHGTATLALAVSALVQHYADGDPKRVARLGGRFGAMVLMPSTVTLRSRSKGSVISYEVFTQDGAPAIRNGYLELQ